MRGFYMSFFKFESAAWSKKDLQKNGASQQTFGPFCFGTALVMDDKTRITGFRNLKLVHVLLYYIFVHYLGMIS